MKEKRVFGHSFWPRVWSGYRMTPEGFNQAFMRYAKQCRDCLQAMIPPFGRKLGVNKWLRIKHNFLIVGNCW